MSAYGKSQQSGAPYMVEELLRELHQAYEETGDGRLRPTSRSFNTCVSRLIEDEINCGDCGAATHCDVLVI